MGCLNDQDFGHWFGNVHLSGPCNRSCYFCIGQHMMGVDPLNTLDSWPLPGFDAFVSRCQDRQVRDVNLTGTNTDPLMYRHHADLVGALRKSLPWARVGIRTNGVMLRRLREVAHLYDKASVSVSSFDPDIYRATMGSGQPPDVRAIADLFDDLKVNVVLCPETVGADLMRTLATLADLGVRRVNVREPYGQPRIGDPLVDRLDRVGDVLGCPSYMLGPTRITYWDVHMVHVSSVNLFAQGRLTEEYSVSAGHAESGVVMDQSHFTQGRQVRQWAAGGAVLHFGREEPPCDP